MGCDTVLRLPVHFIGADLDLKRKPLFADQRCMKGLVAVRLGHCDIVFEAAGDRLVHLMDDAERRVTVLDGPDDNADSEQVIDLVHALALVDHLFVDTEEVLDSSVYPAFDARLFEVLADFVRDLVDVFFSLAFTLRHLLHKVLENVRFEVF